MLMAMQKGVDRLKAARDVVARTAVPLLGSTLIAIFAFGAIGLSQDNTGEFTRSLFVVLLLSLGMSWITAVTVTPLFGYLFLKQNAATDEPAKDPYAGKIYQGYRRLLIGCLNRKPLFLISMVALLASAVYSYRHVDQSFFPESTREQFLVDVWLPANTRIDRTIAATEAIRQDIKTLPGVKHVTTTVGAGAPRFLLTYSPELPDTGYAQFIIDVDGRESIDGALEKLRLEIAPNHPDALLIPKRFLLGPGDGGRIQARISGPDHDRLRVAAVKAMQILREDGGAMGVRIDSREKVPVLQPQFSEAQARLTGITRTDLGRTLQTSFSGHPFGVYREGDNLLPIVGRAPYSERANADYIRDLQIFSPVAGRFIPVRQIVSDFTAGLEDPIIHRRNRIPTITIHADQTSGHASDLHARVREKIESIPLPEGEGYNFEWGGEYENSASARAAVAKALPPFVLLMVLIVVGLFNCLRITSVIWLLVPFSLIGIVYGLLLFGQPFGFMALLGALSLSGMLIKNAIVLIDEMQALIREGKTKWDAIIDASVSRVRPVSMAALTTMLGLIPLLFDVFFGSMAVTIIFGLAFATALTLLVVPVLYALFFGVKPPAEA
jgi:multidrug efflux pump subunit AcrB